MNNNPYQKNRSNPYNQNRNQDRGYRDYNYNQVDYPNRSGNAGYTNQDYNHNREYYNRINYMPDNDENRNPYDRDYESTQYGTSGTYGYRGDRYNNDQDYNYNSNQGNNFDNSYYRDQYGNVGNSRRQNNNYERQDWGRANVNTFNYDDYGRNHNGNYSTGYQNENNYGQGGYGYADNNYNRNRERNRYAKPYDHYRNSNRGTRQDRDWWDRTRDEVSSWFGDDEAEQRRMMDRANGPYKGRGPKDYHRSNERIKEDVCDRLSDNPMLDASDIEVKIEGNEVILAGTVHSREDKRRAEDIAESVSGVSNVQNQLRVHQSDQASGVKY